MKGNQNKLIYFFIGLIAVLNGLQASFTELIYDEAYYWYFSTQLDWGYFDHPPMVAWMIALGGVLFKGTLGVRLLGVLMAASTYLLIWETISGEKKQQHINSFIVLLFSMTLLNAYGFFSLPDSPLLFFTALLLFLLKRFYQEESWTLSMSIGLVMAALMYSKYHAVLVILGVIFGNLKLLKNPKAWAALGVSLLAYTPHLYWLYKYEFVSVAYHLFERSNRAYDFFDFGLGYFVNLIAIFGFCFPFIYWGLYLATKQLKAQSKDMRLQKSMIGMAITVLAFFFISSFNRRIQTQWIVVICIPIAIMVFEIILKNPSLKKQLWVSGLLNIAVILFLRLGLVYEPLLPISYEAHGNKTWTAALQEKVGNAKVVFKDSYRNAPMYAFYTGATTYSLNSIDYRQNQYNIDGSEKQIRGARVAFISKDMPQAHFSFPKSKEATYYGKWIDNFNDYSLLKCEVLETDQGQFTFSIYNPYDFEVPTKNLKFGVALLNKYKQFKTLEEIVFTNETLPTVIAAGAIIKVYGRVKEPANYDKEGYFKISYSNQQLPYLTGGNNEKISQWKPF